MPDDILLPSNTTIKKMEVWRRAQIDRSPVTVFVVGNTWDDLDGVIVACKGGARARRLKYLLIANGFLQPDKPVSRSK